MKNKRLYIEVTQDMHTVIKLRSHLRNMTMSEYVLLALMEKMDRDLGYQDRDIIYDNDN
jgi:hypothetical protein